MKSLKIISPAKINLFLRVKKKRSDGYHEISTFFQQIDLFDTITISKGDGGVKIFSNSNEIPLDETNLVYRAAKLLLGFVEKKHSANIFIEKIIPVSAGLGGGSSNAASTLYGLNKFWGLGVTENVLKDLSISLGADVPFFFQGPSSYGEGIGDLLKDIKINKKIYCVLVNPNISISAKWAYENLRLTKSVNTSNMLDYLYNIGKGIFLEHYFVNDLETSVCERYPIISRVKSDLKAYGAKFVLMSGSGSTVFGIFNSNKDAESAYKKLNKSIWKVFLVKFLQNRVVTF